MPKRYETTRLAAIEAILRRNGPMTAPEIADEMEIPTQLVTNTIQSARSRRPGKSFRIARYQPVIGRWAPDAPVWAAAAGKDVERGVVDPGARSAAWEQRRRERHGQARTARNRVIKAAKRGVDLHINPYLQLLPASSRGYIAARAANSALRSAA